MDQYIEVKLHDADTGEEFNINLSQADASKAETDLAFATSLLNVARQSYFQNETSRHVSASTNNVLNARPLMRETTAVECEDVNTDVNINGADVNDADPNTRENMDGESSQDGFRWSHAAVMLLLEEYRRYENNMSSGKITHKRAWNEIAANMISKGYLVTGRQCRTRVNTMKRTYKSIKDHNGKSGNNKRTWQYLEIMESFLGEKPYMAPIATISSTGAVILRPRSTSITSNSSCCSLSSSIVSDNTDSNDPTRVSRKRKANNMTKDDNKIAEAIFENRRIAEEAKQKRHKEKMEVKMKLLEKLDKILDKI